MDKGQSRPDRLDDIPPDEDVYFKMFATLKGTGKQCQLIKVPYHEAATLEKHQMGRVTFKGVCNG